MTTRIYQSVLILLISCLSISCIETLDDFPEPQTSQSGMKPIYFEGTMEYSVIETMPARDFEVLGNFVLYDHWMFIVEQYEGIHVLDNSDPSNPINTAFIRVPSVTQITADDNALFVNFAENLVILDIYDIENIAILDVIESFYDTSSFQHFPPNYSGFFECADESKGTVIGWKSDTLLDPKCWL
jgi:hypothetical protein